MKVFFLSLKDPSDYRKGAHVIRDMNVANVSEAQAVAGRDEWLVICSEDHYAPYYCGTSMRRNRGGDWYREQTTNDASLAVRDFMESRSA